MAIINSYVKLPEGIFAVIPRYPMISPLFLPQWEWLHQIPHLSSINSPMFGSEKNPTLQHLFNGKCYVLPFNCGLLVIESWVVYPIGSMYALYI